MRPQSAKAKGRRLQQEVRDAVLLAFPGLEPGDVRSTSMGASGADLLLSPTARKAFPYYVECKNVESLNVWKALQQVSTGAFKDSLIGPPHHDTPLLVIRRNNTPAYAVIPFEHFMELVRSDFDHYGVRA